MIGPSRSARKAGKSRCSKARAASACAPIPSSPCAATARRNPSAVRATAWWSQRENANSAAVRSLGNVPWAAEVGIFAQYWWVPWLRTRTEVRQGFHGHHGIVSDITTDAVVPVGPQLTLSAGPRLTLATTPAVSPYFNITPAQSVRSGLPIYDTKGGIRSYGAGAQARYLWTPQWATHVFVEYERLSGEPAGSP